MSKSFYLVFRELSSLVTWISIWWGGGGGAPSKLISHVGSAIAAVLRKIIKVDSVVGNKN